jgi:hypothetical protein
MKPVFKRIATALAIAGVSAVLVGCGSSNNTVPAVLPGSTIPGIGGLPGGGGCVPITQPIPFTGQNIYFSYSSIVGGYVPGASQPIGQVVIGGAVAGGQFTRDAVDMYIAMNVIPAQMTYGGQYPPGYPGSIYPGGAQYPTVPPGYQYPTTSGIPGYNQYAGFGQTPGAANVQGMIQIKPATQQEIMLQFGGGYGGYGTIPGVPGQPGYPSYPGYPTTGVPGQYPGAYGQVPCVSSVAFNLGNYDGILYGGFVWLYLNGTQHGVYYPI